LEKVRKNLLGVLFLTVCFSGIFMAVEAKEQQVENTSSLAQAVPQKGLAAEMAKDWEGAIKIYKEEIAKNSNRPDLWKRIADIEIHLKHFPNAIDALNNAIKLQANNTVLYVNLSEVYAISDKAKDALNAINKALDIEPKNVDYLRRRVILANWLGDYDQVEDSYNRLLKIDPNDQLAHVGLENINAKKNETKAKDNINVPSTSEKVSEQGLDAEMNKDWGRALNIYKEALAKNPKRVDLWKRIADIEIHLKHFPNAIDALNKVIKLEPNNTELYLNISQVYATAKQPKEALLAIDQALKIEPNNVDYLRKRVILANWAGDYEQVEDSYKRLLIIDPNDKLARLGLENIQAKKNEAKASGAPESPETALKSQAEKALNAKDYTLAEKIYCEILRMSPDSNDGLMGLIRVEVGRDDENTAASRYKYFLSLYPDSKEVWLDYAKLQSWRGDYISALELIEIYRQKYGATKEYLAEKARLYSMLGYPEQALCLLYPLLEQSPNDYGLRFTEASALQGNNQPRAALNAWCNVEAQFPKNVDDNKYLRDAVWVPNRSNVDLNVFGYHDTDEINMFRMAIAGKFFLNPETCFILGAKQEYQRATVGSGLDTIQGFPRIWDSAQWAGLTHRFSPKFEMGGIMGIGEIQRNKSFAKYELHALGNPNDYFSYFFQVGRDLYALSPRAVSLRILRKYNQLNFNFQPCPQHFINVGFEYDTFSDSNRRRSVSLYPHENILASQYIDIDIGPYAYWESFIKRPSNGYYDPLSYRLYQVYTHITLKQNENINYIITLAAGGQRDETMPNSRFAGDASLRAIFGIYLDWQLIISANIAARNGSTAFVAQSGRYRLYTAEATLTRRF
jgi:tetratricopeptide (TPR) repeat protein